MEDFSIFDFSKSVSQLEFRINFLKDQIKDTEREITNLQAAGDYTSVTTDAITSLETQKSALETKLADTQTVLQEINNILDLTTEEKALLYYFYSSVTTTKQAFMSKLLFNYSTALADPMISTLVSDTTTPDESKYAVANVIYSKYSVNEEYEYIISSLYFL